MRVEVTLEDIAQGKPHDPECCPVALALKRALPHRHVLVQDGSLKIEGEVYYMPTAVKAFVGLYDNGLDVAPIEFDTDELQLDYAAMGEEEDD
jgi:hypothetical protein